MFRKDEAAAAYDVAEGLIHLRGPLRECICDVRPTLDPANRVRIRRREAVPDVMDCLSEPVFTADMQRFDGIKESPLI